MDRGWKLTLALAVLLAVAAAVYFASPSDPGTPSGRENLVLTGLSATDVDRIEVARKEGGSIAFERTKDGLGEYWKMTTPSAPPADPNLVQPLFWPLERLQKTGALEAGKPETAPEITGLADPRAVVTYQTVKGPVTVRFGKSPPSNATAVFVQKDGDPKIYLADVGFLEAATKPAVQYRAKPLLRFPAHTVHKVVLEYRFTVKRGQEAAKIEYERSVLERIEQGVERGWFLTEPHREKMEDLKVQGLVTELARLELANFQPAGEAKARGLDEPQAKVSLYLRGADKPVEVHFGGEADRGKKRWVTAPGVGEAGLLDAERFEELPLQRKHVRLDRVFDLVKPEVRWIEVDAPGLGKVLLERRETQKAGDPVTTVTWAVMEPKDLRAEAGRVEAFVDAVLGARITDFLGAQDFKLARLDPADVKVTISPKAGGDRTAWFGVAADGFLRREGVPEVFVVKPEFVRMLQRLELNFMHAERFNVPRNSLLEVTVDSKASGQLIPTFYRLRTDGKGGPWRFADPAHEKEGVDAGALGNLLAVMNYIRAEALITKDPAEAAKLGLDAKTAPMTLRIVHEGGEVEIYVSADLSDKIGRERFYAKLKDDPVVFQISTEFVRHLKVPPVAKK